MSKNDVVLPESVSLEAKQNNVKNETQARTSENKTEAEQMLRHLSCHILLLKPRVDSLTLKQRETDKHGIHSFREFQG